MTKILTVAALLQSILGYCQLQQRTEVGGGLGTFNYTGDLVRTYNFVFSKPAATVFYRNNLSKVVSFRAALTFGNVGASDKNNPIDLAAKLRNSSFKLSLLELSGVYEYHFLDWREGKKRLRFTPYLFAGAAIFVISGNKSKPSGYSNVQMAIPFGGGLKYVINPKWYASIEFGIRKTFFDYLDNVSGGDPAYKTYQYGNFNDLDNYFFFGLSITRTFYDIPCPTNPYKKSF